MQDRQWFMLIHVEQNVGQHILSSPIHELHWYWLRHDKQYVVEQLVKVKSTIRNIYTRGLSKSVR